MKLIRPTKEMMLAINGQLDGDIRLADSLVREHGLDRKEMQLRIEKRGGEKYNLDQNRGGKRKGKRGRGPGRVIQTASAPARDLFSMIDGRTKTATLVRLEGRIDEILTLRNGKDVTKIRDAMRQIIDLKRKLQEAESILDAS